MGIEGIGELYVYDAALRLGSYLKIRKPKYVYLHAGARVGAKALGVRGTRADRTQFPDLYRLRPHQIENFLCIYKDPLTQNQSHLVEGNKTQSRRIC